MQNLYYKVPSKQKSRILIVLLFSILLSAGLLYYIGSFTSMKSIWVYFFLAFSILSSIRVLTRKYTLMVDAKGLHSDINGMKGVSWEEIDHFYLKENSRKHLMLLAKLKDEEAYLSRKNPMTRLLMRSNVRALGSSVVFPQAEFEKNLEEVKTEIEAYQQKL